MRIKRLNLRNVATAACLAGVVMFSGCKEPENNQKGKPSAVTNLTATAGNGQVKLSWNAPSKDGGSEITGYEVTMDNWATKVTKKASELSHTYTGLTNDREYEFKVRAVNANGEGAESAKKATPKGGSSGEPDGWPPADLLAKYGLDGMNKPTGHSNGSFIEAMGSLTIEFEGNASTYASIKDYFHSNDWVVYMEDAFSAIYTKTVSGTNYTAVLTINDGYQFMLRVGKE